LNDNELLVRAASFAADRHRDQRRKNGDIPYVNHPLEVARLLVEVGKETDGELLAAAMLHDTVEDTDATPDELERRFGKRIAGLVAEVTDDKSLPKATRKRKQIEHAPHLTREAKLIKMADKLSNLKDIAVRPPDRWPPDRIRGYFVWARTVVEALGDDVHPELRGALDALFKEHTPADAGERKSTLDQYLASLADEDD